MKTEKLPYEKIVFVCTNARKPGEKISCAGEGRPALSIRETLKDQINSLGLKGRVRVCSSGCLDQCDKGPNAVIFHADGRSEWLTGLQISDVSALLNRLTGPYAS